MDITLLRKKSKDVLGIIRVANREVILYGSAFVSKGAAHPRK